MMHILQDKRVVCSKDHKCEWCGELIEKGSEAQYRAYIHEKVFQSQWQHTECYNAMNDTDWSYDDSYHQGEMGRGSTYPSGEEPEEHNEGQE